MFEIAPRTLKGKPGVMVGILLFLRHLYDRDLRRFQLRNVYGCTFLDVQYSMCSLLCWSNSEVHLLYFAYCALS